jgi:hypothetical protein
LQAVTTKEITKSQNQQSTISTGEIRHHQSAIQQFYLEMM